ncbi:MAG: HEPN domain-containing protein [Nitrososphaeria archaeon]
MVKVSIYDKDEYERWVKQADATLASAKRDRDAGDYNWSCFKAQQAAEFAVKGLLYGLGFSPVGHSILKLLGEIEKKGVNVEQLKECARTLDRHYIPTRYANAHAEGAPFEYYDLVTAEKAIECATNIISFVKEVSEYA